MGGPHCIGSGAPRFMRAAAIEFQLAARSRRRLLVIQGPKRRSP